MPDMPRKRFPYVHRVKTRHDKIIWYFRRGTDKRTRIRLRAEYGTAAFQAEYEAALQAAPAPLPIMVRSKPGSLEWLYERYRETGKWTGLSAATRRQRENIFKGVMDVAGDVPAGSVTRKKIEQGKDDRRNTPAQARNFLDAMRGLFRWALKAEHVAIDPTAGVENPARPSGDGFIAWSEDDIERYELRWPKGTRQRVWLHVLLYTGLRRGDAVRLGRQHVREGVAALKTEKTGMEVNIPILPVLAETLAAGPIGDLAFICGESGRPLAKESFGNLFKKACRAAGIGNKSAHGVRKLTATRCADNGATTYELMAIMGWKNTQTAEIYTRNADRKRLAKGAATKMQRNAR